SVGVGLGSAVGGSGVGVLVGSGLICENGVWVGVGASVGNPVSSASVNQLLSSPATATPADFRLASTLGGRTQAKAAVNKVSASTPSTTAQRPAGRPENALRSGGGTSAGSVSSAS